MGAIVPKGKKAFTVCRMLNVQWLHRSGGGGPVSRGHGISIAIHFRCVNIKRGLARARGHDAQAGAAGMSRVEFLLVLSRYNVFPFMILHHPGAIAPFVDAKLSKKGSYF